MTTETKEQTQEQSKTFSVRGMTCASCVRHVEGALLKVEGVETAQVNLATERVTVSLLPDVTVRELRSSVDASGYEGEAHIHVGCTTPMRAIEEGIENLNPELLVLGTVSRGGIPGLLLGNTAKKVLRRIDRSLLTVKPEDFVSPVRF